MYAWSSLYIFTQTVRLYNLKFECFSLLSNSAQTILTQVNVQLDKFTDGLVIVLAFGVLAKFLWAARGSSDKMMNTVRSGKISNLNTPATFGNSIEEPNAYFRYNFSWCIYNRKIVSKFPVHGRHFINNKVLH